MVRNRRLSGLLVVVLAIGMVLNGFVIAGVAESAQGMAQANEQTHAIASEEEMNQAYDEAMLDASMEVTFLSLPPLCQHLSELMSYTFGEIPAASEDSAGNVAVQVVDELIRRAEWCFYGGDKTDGTDMTSIADAEESAAFENAIANWRAGREALLAAYSDPASKFEPGARLDDETVMNLADKAFNSMPFEIRIQYLEAGKDVCYAIWLILRRALVNEAGEALEASELSQLELGEYEEAALEVFDWISSFRTGISVMFEKGRYEYREQIEQIQSRLTLLDETVKVICRTVGIDV